MSIKTNISTFVGVLDRKSVLYKISIIESPQETTTGSVSVGKCNYRIIEHRAPKSKGAAKISVDQCRLVTTDFLLPFYLRNIEQSRNPGPFVTEIHGQIFIGTS